MPPTNVPFVIDSTLTTDDSSLAGTVGNVIIYRKVEEEKQKVTARIFSIDGDIHYVCVQSSNDKKHEPGPRWLRMPTVSGVPAARAGLL